jgi:hypothetical protein
MLMVNGLLPPTVVNAKTSGEVVNKGALTSVVASLQDAGSIKIQSINVNREIRFFI